MKRVLGVVAVIAAIAMFSIRAEAQGVRYQNIAITPAGRPAAGASVRVCTSPSTGSPCTPLAPHIYSNADLGPTHEISNPLTVDQYGNYWFYAAQGTYTVQVTYAGATTTFPDQALGLPIIPTGNWDVARAYNTNELVYYGGNAYIATASNTGVTPGSGDPWQIFVLGGGGGSSVTIQTNGTNNTLQSLLNLQSGTGIALSNPSGGTVSLAAVPPTTTVAGLSALASPQEGQTANVTDGPRSQFIYKNTMWRPASTEINVQDFGARGDGGWYTGFGALPSGSNSVSVGIRGATPVAGMTLVVPGAGVAGADFTCTISSFTAPHIYCGGGATTSTSLATNNNQNGAYWGWSVDDTPALNAAKSYCATNAGNGGCTILFPAGAYFIKNFVFPAISGVYGGQIQLRGVGRQSTWLVGTGGNQTAILQAPANSVSTYVEGFGFTSVNPTLFPQTAVQWLGGVEHTFTNNFATNVYEMVNASNTWINLISNNRCYSATNCIEFGGSGTGPVNATHVLSNELAAWSNWAIWTHTNTASYGNDYAFNSIENDNPPFAGAINLTDNAIRYQQGYYEVSAAVSTSGYEAILSGYGTYDFRGGGMPCSHIIGGGIIILGSANGTQPCASGLQIIDDVGVTFYGMSPASVGGTKGSSDTYYGTAAAQPILQAGSLTSYRYAIGSAYDLPYGRVDIVSTPFGRSNTAGNPTYPTQMGTAATVPYGMLMANQYEALGATPGTNTSTYFLVCNHSPNCTTNPAPVASEWIRMGKLMSKVETEGTAAPASGTWAVGDFVRNTNPASTKIFGWICTVAGTPGTWVPIYAIDPANPPAWGGTTPAAGAFTTLSTSGLATLASASVTGALTAGTVNKLTLTAPATSATLTINDGKTLTVSNTMQLASTDSAVITFQGTDTYVGRGTTDTLSNKTLTAPIISNSVVGSLPAAASSTGMIYVVTDSNSATSCGTGGGSSIVLCRSNGSSWLPLGDGASSGAADFASLTGGTNTGAAMLVGTGATLGTTGTGTIQATNVLGAGLTFAGSTSGTTVLKATAIAGTTTLTLPAATDTLVGKATTDTLSNKTLDNTSSITVKDGSFTLQNTTDATKQATFTLAGITTGTTRVVTIPDAASSTVVADAGASHNFLTAISAAGAISKAQPAFTDISGNIATSQMNSGTGASSSTWWRGDGTWASLPGGTGTVNSGAQYAIAYYASAGTAVSGHPNLLTNAAGNLLMTQGANNTDALTLLRATDSLPTGNLIRGRNAANNADLFVVDRVGNVAISGGLTITKSTILSTSPDIQFTSNPGACTLSGASTGIICLSSTGNRLIWGYNGGSNTPFILGSDNLSALAATTSAQLAGVISDETGSGSLVFATSPTLVTPTLGVATATSINKMAITAPATSSTLAVADGKTFTVNNTLTFIGTDSTTMTFPATSANIFGSVTKADVLEAGLFCADAGATDAYACTLSPAITAYVTGATYIVKANTANTGAATVNLNALGVKTIKKHAGGITSDLVSNDIQAGAWIALTYDGTNMQCTAGCDGNAASGTITSGTTNVLSKYTAATTLGNSLLSDDGTTLAYTGTGGISVAALTITGTAGADTYTEIAAPASPTAGTLKGWADSTDHRFHDKNSSGTIGTTVVAGTLSAHNFVNAVSAAGVVSGAQPACGDLSDAGTACTATIGNYAPLVSPSFTTPTLGVASATSINKVAITAPATSATLTIADGKTLTASNTLTFTGTDSSSVAFGTGGTVRYTTSTVNTVVDTSSPVTVSTTLGAEFHFNENATAGTAVTYNLPTAAAGKQFCFANAYNGSAANTGALTIATSAAGQYIIYTDGTLSASGGNVASGGAAGDAACVVGVDATHWMAYVQRGTWTKN